jgi:hypothetical protein
VVSVINIKKTQSPMKKAKTKEEALDIYNKIKIIRSSDETFELWSKVIYNHSQGKLYDPETNPLQNFKGNKCGRPINTESSTGSFSSGLKTYTK